MTIRESGLATGIGWTITVWACWFTTDLIWRADNVTSKQWQYLMSVPGHQWSWATLFGAGAILLILGMITTSYRIRAVGIGTTASGCGFIAGFYVAAPLINPGLTTLGYHPWLFCAIAMLFCAVVNWRPITWF